MFPAERLHMSYLKRCILLDSSGWAASRDSRKRAARASDPPLGLPRACVLAGQGCRRRPTRTSHPVADQNLRPVPRPLANDLASCLGEKTGTQPHGVSQDPPPRRHPCWHLSPRCLLSCYKGSKSTVLSYPSTAPTHLLHSHDHSSVSLPTSPLPTGPVSTTNTAKPVWRAAPSRSHFSGPPSH